jgi:hypothetical protein
MTPEEIQQQLLEAMQNMADITKRQYELQEKQLKDSKELHDKRQQLSKNSLEDEKKTSENTAKAYKNRLGLEEEFNPKIKKVLDNRADIEQRIIDQAKKKYGEEAFIESQRNKFFREQLQKYSDGTRAYGGVVTTFEDLNKNQQRAIVDSAKTQQRLQQEQEKFAKTVQTLANPGQAIGDMSGKFSSLGGVLDSGKESLIKLAGGGVAATASLELAAGAAKVVGSAFEGAAKAAMTMGKSLINGERGMSVGAKGVTAFTNSITGAVKAFGDLAIGIGALLVAISPFTLGVSGLAGAALMAGGAVLKLGASAAETAAELNEIAANLNDKLFAGFKELGKLSMTGAQGMTAIIDNLHKMGLTVAEFDKFKAVITANAKEMKMFGATAEQGVNKFVEVSGELYKSKMGKTLELMGISAEDQYEHTAKYLALQARLGFAEEKNAQNLARSTKGYIEELDKIAEITGASRKEQEDARNAIMGIQELRAGILDEQRKIKEGTGDAERLKRMERAVEVATSLQAQGLTRGAAGIAKYYGAGGAVTDTMSAEAMQTFGQTIKDINEGKKGAGALGIQATRESVSKAEQTSQFRKYGASGEGIYGEDLSKAGDAKARMARYEEARQAEMKKQGSAFDEEKFIAAFNKQRVADDSTTKQNVENNRKQMDIAIQLDRAVFKYNEAVGINKMATDAFKKAVDLFANVAGYMNGKSNTGAATAPGSAPALGETQGGAATGSRATMKRSASSVTESGRMGSMMDPRSLVKSGGQIESSQLTIDDIVKFTSNTGSKEHFSKLDSGVSEAFAKMASEYYDTTGSKLQINSSYRSPEEQANVNSGTNPKAAPGKSKHNYGRALDLNSFDVNALKTLGLLDKYGFNTIPNDPPHIEMARTGGVFTGPSSGYPVELHGREAVVPLPNPDSIISISDNTSKPEKQPLSSAMTSNTSQSNNDSTSMILGLIEMLSNKLDNVIDVLEDGNDTSSKILTYSMV